MLEKNKKVFMAFLDLEKVYDQVLREVGYWCLRKQGVAEELVKVIKATYEGTRTKIRTEYGYTEPVDIEVGVHQGSALSPFLFILAMDTLTADTGIEIPWELIFADDIALMVETEEELKEKVRNGRER